MIGMMGLGIFTLGVVLLLGIDGVVRAIDRNTEAMREGKERL